MMQQTRFTDLLDLAEGRLDEERARAVRDQLAADRQAQQTLEWIEGFLADARLLPLHQPPPELSARLRSMFIGAQPGVDDDWAIAELLYDTGRQAVAGVRSAATGEQTHLAFDSPAGRFVIELRGAGSDAVDIEGLVLLEGSGAGADLTFLEGDVVRAVARVQRDGRFEARGVSTAVDEFRLVSGSVRLRAALDLRGR